MSFDILSKSALQYVLTKLKGVLSTVALTGSYNDLQNKPTIPTNTNQLTNGAGFITSSGSCASATKATQDADGFDIRQRYVNIYNTNNIGQSSSVTLNDLAAQGSSVAMIHAATDNPTGGAKWVHALSMAWGKGTNTSWVSQLAMGTENGTGLWYRTGSGTIVGRAWKRVIDSDTIGSQSVNYAVSANTANCAARLGRGGSTSTPMVFNWSGQSGQPSWLWGGSDGTNMYVYNPSNFSVNYANSAGSATNCTNAVRVHSSNDRSEMWCQDVSGSSELRGQSDYNLVWYKNGSAIWYTGTSSRRFKRNVHSMTEERAKRILKIRPVTFDWIDKQPFTTRQCDNAGVIAEEVSQVIPDVVVFEPYDEDPNVMIERSVEYSRFTPYLIKMVQIQQKQIDDLTKRIEELEAKV